MKNASCFVRFGSVKTFITEIVSVRPYLTGFAEMRFLDLDGVI
jgi:hypothetical protein